MTSRFVPPHMPGLGALPFVVPLLLALAVLAFLMAVYSWGTLPPAMLLPEAGAESVAAFRAQSANELPAPTASTVFAGQPAEAPVQVDGSDPLRPRPARRPRP